MLEQIIAWLECVAPGWNASPTPLEWGGKRAARRQRARERRHRRVAVPERLLASRFGVGLAVVIATRKVIGP